MSLDLSPLESSVGALKRALGVVSDSARWNAFDGETREALHAGVIQTFEVCYEQCWKIARRWLMANADAAEVDGATRRHLFRLSASAGLIDDVDLWMLFHQARNETSHTYNRAKAQSVIDIAPRFAVEAARLVEILRARND